jgi:hypothetical protein
MASIPGSPRATSPGSRFGSSSMTRAILAIAPPGPPLKACWPVSISWSSRPNEKMSVAGPTSFPRHCSGDM